MAVSDRDPDGVDERFDRLTLKERQVLDLVVERRTSKEIARSLGIVPNTVDLRVRSAKVKLGAQDRNETARIYEELRRSCGQTTCGPTVIVQRLHDPVAALPEQPLARFTLNDAANLKLPAPWHEAEPATLPEAWDKRFGMAWRLAAIPLGALGIALLALALLAIASTLGMLLPR